MARLSKTFRIVIVLAVLVLASFHLLSVSIENQNKPGQNFSPIERAVLAVYQPVYGVFSWPFRKAGEIWNNYFALVNLKELSQNQENEIAKLKDRLVKYDELLYEVQKLRAYFDFSEQTVPVVTAAQVVSRSYLKEVHTVLLDRGRIHGIEPGMIAVTDQGLVGYVTTVAGRISRVRLITDSLSAVHVIVQRSRATGVVKGSSSGSCRLQYTHWTDDVQVGDSLISSGQSLFPKGLLVGTISRIEKPESGSLGLVTVTPAVDLARLEMVAVLAMQQHLLEAEQFEEFSAAVQEQEPEP